MNKRSKKKCLCPPKKSRNQTQVKQPEDCRMLINIIKELSQDPEFADKPEKRASHQYGGASNSESPRKKDGLHRNKAPKLRHDPATCVPMTPSMHTRLRIRGEHCKYDYGAPPKVIKPASYRCAENLPAEEERHRKCVHYGKFLSEELCPVIMPKPLTVVWHACSDQSLLRVPSPTLVGEVVIPQPASLTPSEHRAPLPSRRDISVHKPRSGLYINITDDFVPDGGGGIGAEPRKRRRAKRRSAARKKPKCSQTLRDRHQQYKKQAQKRKLQREKQRRCTEGALSQMSDGKPQNEKNAQKHLNEDDAACGPDQIPSPQHVTMPKNLKRGTLQSHSLTTVPCSKGKQPKNIHFGILTSSYNMNESKYGSRSRGQQALTMSVMAYCLAFHYHPKQWNMGLMDTILDCGDRWYIQCLDKVHDHSMVQGICEVLPFGKKHTLILNGKKMQIILGEPEVVGYTMNKDPMVYNLCRGLKMFFKCNRACIFLSRILKVVIWKDSVCYYIFDPAGRDARAFANSKEGKAALINVQDLEGVTELLLARSVIEDQKYVLAVVKVLRMADEDSQEDFGSDHDMTPTENTMAEYKILSETCAVVNASLHLGDTCFEDAKFRQALPIAVVAMIYAKISPPNTWNTKTLDKVLRLGTKLYLDCTLPNVLIDMTIDNIPTDITVGPYKSEIIIYRERVKGQLFTNKECILNIRRGLNEFFKKEYNSGIIQFSNYTLAVWRQKEMYYIFDPYPCSPDGLKAAKGQACVLMNLNPDSAADMLTMSWDYLPPTTQFCIHAFKVLRLKKQEFKVEILCLSEDDVTEGGRRRRRKRLKGSSPCHCHGDEQTSRYAQSAVSSDAGRGMISAHSPTDEEHLGDITSLVDSILEDYVPHIPLRYKYPEPEPQDNRLANLDSPTVSVTQMVPPVPAPRDKTGEAPEPDPDPEPDPPPPPPPVQKGEGSEEEEEEEVEEEEEKEPEKVEVKEEELPPPPPSPEPEPEPELAPEETQEDTEAMRQNVRRRVLLTADARQRFKLRELRKQASPPLEDNAPSLTPSAELLQPSNFKQIPDGTEIIRGANAIKDERNQDVLPFFSIMAIVTSYKYKINTWSPGIIDFVVDTARKLFERKEQKFQFAPVHVIPKIAIGQQEYEATVEVGGEGATWQLERALTRFFQRRDRCMITTSDYSCAVFRKSGLYYLVDGAPCNALGLRDSSKNGSAVLLRFESLHLLVHRFMYNKDGSGEQQFIVSRVLVRRLARPQRERLPDLGGDASAPCSAIALRKGRPEYIPDEPQQFPPMEEPRTLVGYHYIGGNCRINGTTCLKARQSAPGVKECHFISLVAMLTLAMHPIRTWNSRNIDAVIEKGLEIHSKACNLKLSEKRVIKHILLEDNFINVTIKKVLVINENEHKSIDQYLKAVLPRLKYVIIRFPQCSMVIYQDGVYYHLFDPYAPPPARSSGSMESSKGSSRASSKATSKMGSNDSLTTSGPVASWTLFKTLDALMDRLRQTIPDRDLNSPIFYTYELTSIKKAPKRATFNYKLSPIFKPQVNPNRPLRRARRILPIVDEKMNWAYIKKLPWARGTPYNDLGYQRNTSTTLWRDWDIEFPADLYSLWGTIHPLSPQFAKGNRGKQILAVNTVAIAMTQYYHLSEWTSNVLDAIVSYGDQYHTQSTQSIRDKNHQMALEDLIPSFSMYPYSFNTSFEKVIFGTVYSIHKDCFNLSRALVYFFERNRQGVFMCHNKNLAFGSIGNSYYMFDCQSFGPPVFPPQRGSSYILKCESLNRLIFCMTVTLNIKRHGVQFDIFSVKVELSERSSVSK